MQRTYSTRIALMLLGAVTAFAPGAAAAEPAKAADKTAADNKAAKVAAGQQANGRKKAGRAASVPIEARREADIVYAKADGIDLNLDLYFPKEKSDKPAPMVVYVHGGGWQNGSKTGGGWIGEVTNEMTRRGYVVGSIEYRLHPTGQWPSYIHDVKAGIRFLRANAEKYGIDPDRIGVWGGSAGGHLVSLLGVTDQDDGLEGELGSNGQSSRVQAVVDLFGPSDFSLWPRDPDRLMKQFGSFDNYKPASPVTYVTKDDPPFLILQGDSDPLVPQIHSERLHEKLKAAGVDSTLVIVKNGTHGLNTPDVEPSKDEMVQMMCDFFDKHLGKKSD